MLALGKELISSVDYGAELKRAMTWLGEKPNTIFIGQSVGAPGTAMTGTLAGVPKEKLLELPVFEDVQMGMSTGFALAGLRCGGALAIGLASGGIGAFVVLRRMALVGDALSHVALPGIAFALAYAIDPFWGVVASLVGWWLLFICARTCSMFGGMLVFSRSHR